MSLIIQRKENIYTKGHVIYAKKTENPFEFPNEIIKITNSLMKDDVENHNKCNWHSNDHIIRRKFIEECIFRIIQQRRPLSCKIFIEKLYIVSKQIENRLYLKAENFEE
jgi:hypothetical protein